MTQTFRDFIAWQQGKALAREVYEITRLFPDEERFGLVIQLRRAAVSVPSNIAEGRGRGTKKDFAHFLMQARGSLYEVETQIELANELHYINQFDTARLLKHCDELSRVLNGLINSIT
ncbi:MAG TPA: four helix bundle protein [Terriglobales bacterium]|nr:four helix bundle protein [Terriglobales bacterium]